MYFPDQGANGCSGVKGTGEAATQIPDIFGPVGHQMLNQRQARKPQGAGAMHDGSLESAAAGKFRVNMQGKRITGQPVKQGLTGRRMGRQGPVRRPLRKINFGCRRSGAAKAAIIAAKDRRPAAGDGPAVNIHG